MNITFLIGNGFDINLGMETKYENVYHGYLQTSSPSPVIKYFKKELANRKPYDRWTDFEMGMADYAKTLSSESELIECVRDFKTFLVGHLKNEEVKVKALFPKEEKQWSIITELMTSLSKFYHSLSPNVVNEIDSLLGNSSINYNFLTFNYTNTLEQALSFFPRAHKNTINTPIHIHGTLDNDVVMGVDNLGQLSEIEYPITKRGQRNFVKTLFNEQYDKSRVKKSAQIISQSSTICTYGFSLGESDKLWTDLLIEWLSSDPHHHLIIYQYDTKTYNRHNFDEIMDEEDEKRSILMSRLGVVDDSMSNQIHIPIGSNIFNFGKIKNTSPKNEITDNSLFMAINT